MKLMIASDIHGAADWCRKLMDAFEREQPDKLVLLGDLLYHGPRNDLPGDYEPKQVMAMLNGIAEHIVAVRGNCESEVDQMVLGFPCMADYSMVLDAELDGSEHELFCTHGHLFGPDNLPNVTAGTTVVFGHTHVKVDEPHPQFPSIRLFNPGSVGIPKDGTHSYGIYDRGAFSHVILG